MAVTIKDIARALSISPAAVSLALNGSPMISLETARRVKDMAQKMGYVRNQYARGLVRGRSGTVALVVPDIENVYFATLVKHVASLVPGYDVSITISGESMENEMRALKKLAQQRVEAILLAPVNRPMESAAYLEWLNHCPVPIVFLTARHEGTTAPCVMCDLKSGMRALTEHVIASGARRTALLTGPKGVLTLDLREEGYIEALAEREQPGEIWHVDEITYQNAYSRVRSAEMKGLPDALICVNDMMAIGALNALSTMGVPVPDRMRVAGFDDSIFSEVSFVPLTTVKQDVPHIAKRGVEIALSLIDRSGDAGDEIVPCHVVPRRSTGFLQPEESLC